MPQKQQNFKLILASGSAYRRELLSRLHLPFESIAPDIDENPLSYESPEQTAMRLAEQKAAAIAKIYPNSIVIGSDQVAMLDGEQIGKPGTHKAALIQLQKMRGKNVTFHTALCLIDNRKNHNETQNEYHTQIENVQTVVSFRQLCDAQLDAYLRIEQPYDCAGSAKNEGLGITIIEKIVSSDPTALTGLPLISLTSMLLNIDIEFYK